jgi:hypothetical protein
LSRLALSWSAVGVVAMALVAIAFSIAPRACEGGLETYLKWGLAAIAGVFALPFVARAANDMLVRVGLAFAFALIGAGAWIAGLFIANVQILCRLF